MYITNDQRSVQRLSSWAANYKVGNIRFCESCGMQRPPHLFSSAVLALDKPARSHHFCNLLVPVSLWQTCFVWMTISKNSLIGAQELEDTSFVKEVTPLQISSYKLLWTRPNWKFSSQRYCIVFSFNISSLCELYCGFQKRKAFFIVSWRLSGNTFWKLAKIISTTAWTQCTLLLRRFFWNTWTSKRQIFLELFSELRVK